MARKVVLAGACRTAIGVMGGTLSKTPAPDLEMCIRDSPIPPKEIINQPELQVYVKDFGKNKGDLCLVAEANNEIVGAVWCRIMNDYGHIDAETPSFAISLLKQYRNYGCLLYTSGGSSWYA